MHSYRELCHILFTTEFVWLVPNDDNRVEDGKALRFEFLDDQAMDVPEEHSYWLDLGCSNLELMLALARRLDFETERDVHSWFLELIKNLGLSRYHDAAADIPEDLIKDTLDTFVWRTYDYNGDGGLFPLEHPEQDQRQIEIWYQLNAYLLERSYV